MKGRRKMLITCGLMLLSVWIIGFSVINLPAVRTTAEPAVERGHKASNQSRGVSHNSSVFTHVLFDKRTDPIQRLRLVERDYFENVRVLGHPRPKPVFLTIGIPTMKRPNQAYLWMCLDSLFNNTNDEDKKDIVIVILLSDSDPALRQNVTESILARYKPQLHSGLLQVIRVPPNYYPPLTHLKRTYNHPMMRVRWRSKQNIDYAFLMKYSVNISRYYIQLEDDVTTVPNFLGKIKGFIASVGNFSSLEFSSLGFIGKLFPNRELYQLADLLTVFYAEHPNDVLFIHYKRLMLQWTRHLLKPTIFQHHGYYSSLLIRRSPEKDPDFEGEQKSKHQKGPVKALKPSGGQKAQTLKERPKSNGSEKDQKPIDGPELKGGKKAQTRKEEPKSNGGEKDHKPVDVSKPNDAEKAKENPKPGGSGKVQTPKGTPGPSGNEKVQKPNDDEKNQKHENVPKPNGGEKDQRPKGAPNLSHGETGLKT